ncbi:hypothetical protein ACIPWE_24620 [Streptomyces sp. NPDC090073]|uniref:hypothetical protein n=1 Tax=Streptomyces sp. NPDC090073 TaxID=3365936 RepID=UPI0037FD0544
MPLLLAAPVITLASAGARVTALMGALAVAAQVLIGVRREGLSTADIQARSSLRGHDGRPSVV